MQIKDLYCNNKIPYGICNGKLEISYSDIMPIIQVKNDVQYGILECRKCNAIYPIIDFIPIIIRDPFNYLRENYSVIDTVLKFFNRPIPDKIKTKLFNLFLNMIKKPNEPVIKNRKGYEKRYIFEIISKFHTYAESYTKKEWDQDLFTLGRINIVDKPYMFHEVKSAIERYYRNDFKAVGDIGCNIGGYSQLLTDYFPRVYGIDTSFETIYYANLNDRHKAMPSGPVKPDFIVSEAEITPFLSSYLDMALCLNIIDIVPDPIKIIEELSRIMKKNGIVILTTPFLESSKSTARLLSIADDEIQALKTIISKYGFSILEEKDNILWRLNESARKTLIYNLFMIVIRKD